MDAKFEDMSHHTTHKQVILSDKRKEKVKHNYRSGESHHITSREIQLTVLLRKWHLSSAGSVLSALLILFPVGQDGSDTGRVGETVDVLEVLLGDLEGTSSDVGDVLSNELGGVDGGLVDLLEQEGTERLDTGAQESAVEGDVDTLEGNGGEATLQLNGLGLGLGLLDALLDDADQVSLEVLERHALHKSWDVNVLGLEEVQEVGKAVESAELQGFTLTYITSSDVLHVGNIVVDNLQKPASLLGNDLDDVLQGLLVEGLGDTAGVDGTHGVVGATLLVTLDGNLHGQTTVEHNGNQALDGHDISQGSQGRVFTQRVTGEAAVTLDQTLGAHVLETSFLHEGEGGLGELGGGQKTGRRAVGIRSSVLINLLEDLLGLDGTVGIHRLEGHGHVVLANGLTTGTTEVNGELLGIVLDNVDDGQAIVLQEVTISAVPDLPSNRAAGIELHTHALLLGTLTSEDIGGDGLFDLGLTDKNLLFGLLVASLNLDDLATCNHTDVLQLHSDHVVGQNHADQRCVEATDTTDVVLSSPGLHERTDGSTAVHTVSDSAGQIGIAGEDTRDVDGVVIARDAGVGLVRGRGTQLQGSLAAERNGDLEVDGLLDRGTVTLEVVNDRVTVRDTGLVVYGGNLDDLLGGELQENLTNGLDIAEDGLTEGEGLAKELSVRLVHAEPLLRAEDGNIAAGGEVDLHRNLILALEGVLEVRVGTAVQELAGNLHDGLAITLDGTADLDHLARLLVDDRVDLGSGVQNIANLQGLSTRNHLEAVGQVNQLEEISVNSAREDGHGDGLPASNNGEIHGGEDFLARTVHKGLTSVANSVNKVGNGLAGDGLTATVESGSCRSVEGHVLGAEPDTVVELLDTVVAISHDLADGGVTGLRVVSEEEGQRDNTTLSSAAFEHRQRDLSILEHLGLDSLNQLARLAWSGSHDPLHRVGLEAVALDIDIGQEKGVAPGVGIASQQAEPAIQAGRGRGQAEADLVGLLGDGETLDLGLIGFVNQVATEILDHGDLGLVTTAGNVALVNTIEDVLDRLVNDVREAGGHGTLQNAGAADVLVNNSLQVLTLPERVLLEEVLEILVEDRDERNGLLTTALAKQQEMLNILGVDQLLGSLGVRSQNRVHSGVRSVELGVILQQRSLALRSGEALLHTAQEVTSQTLERVIDPTRLVLDVHQIDHAVDNFGIGHVLEVHSLTSGVAAEPHLMEVVIELLDNVVAHLLQLGDTLGLVELEDLLVHLVPEQDTTGSQLVDGLTHLGEHSDDTASSTLVGLLPFLVVDTGSISDGLLSILGGVSFLGDHHAATEQATVERHRGIAELGRPCAREVRVGILGTSETTTSDQDDVVLLADAAVHLEDGLVEVLEGVVTTTTTTGPLQDDGELGVGLGNVDDLLNGIAGAGLEGNVLDAESLDVLVGDLDGRDTSTNGQTLNGDTLGTQAADQRDLPPHGTGVDVDQVNGDTPARRDNLLDLVDGSGHGLRVVVTTTSQLNVVAGIHSGGDEVPRNSGRGHTSDHNRGDTQQATHLGVNISLSGRCLHQAGAVFLDPIHGVLHGVLITVKELGLVANLSIGAVHLASQNDANAGSILIAVGEDTQARDTTGTKVNDVGGTGEDGSLLPVHGIMSDHADQGRHGALITKLAQVLSGLGVEDRDQQGLGGDLNHILKIL
ncbi:hypothetical protein F1880_009718 [Penicillium rolfsii]|nr:hypothetical protein F1880_009718 [Penicillium rolfsii]